MAGFIQQVFEKGQERNWIFAFYLIFAAYLILDGIVYMANPYSGRISTLNCVHQMDQHTVCTVRIYGVGETYQHSFWAEDFQKATTKTKFVGSSDSMTCGVLILTARGPIDFAHPVQKCVRAERTTELINQAFSESGISPLFRVSYIGFNTSLYRRALLLAIGSLVLYAVCRSPQPFPNKFSYKGKGDFTKKWFWGNFSVRIFFCLANAFILAVWSFNYPTEQSDFLRSCGRVFISCDFCDEFPYSYIFCSYPLIAILVLQALVQRTLLKKTKIYVSVWWVLTPVIASISLMVISPGLNCDDCRVLKYLMAGILLDHGAQIKTGLVVYFIVIGIFQWLILRRNLPNSYGWVIMPLISSMLVVPVYIFLNSGAVESTFFLLMVPMALIAGEYIVAKYVAWLIYEKNLNHSLS